MRTLDRQGALVTGRHVVVRFPAGALTEGKARAVVARLDRGIGAAKRFIGKPDWRFRGDPRLYFYLPDEKFVSHAPGGNTAFVPLWRIRDDQAPWLHEALHLLLDPAKGDWLSRPAEEADQRMPLWLYEGLAESLAMDVAAQEGLAHYSPLIEVPASGVDALCAERLRTAQSEKVLARIGARGKLPELFGPDRIAYAAPFYACSTSFVRYLTARFGKAPLLRSIAAFDAEQEELERSIGLPLAQAKADWLKGIGAGEPGSPSGGAAPAGAARASSEGASLGPLPLPAGGVVPVAFVLVRDAEVLDFTGPLEVFAAAWTPDGKPAFKPYFVAADLAPVTAGDRMEYQGTGWLDPRSNAAYATLPPSGTERPLCPLCRMEGDPAIRSELHGKTYYFCSPSEKSFFDEHPEVMERFLAEDAARAPRQGAER